MGKGTASALTFATGGILVSIALLRKNSASSGQTYRRIWAAGLLTAGLSVFADFVPELVGPFALLIIIAAVASDKGALGSLLAGPAKSAAPANATPH
jgi:hypothetical protein